MKLYEYINKFLIEKCNDLKDSTKRQKSIKLNQFGRFMKNNANITQPDIIKYINSKRFKALEISTQNLHKVTLRQFFHWMGVEYEENLLKRKKEIIKQIKKSDLLTKKEFRDILKNLPNSLYKAYIILSKETKARKGELLNLKLGDLTFYETYAMVFIRVSKTTQRNIPIIESIPYLMRYLEDHPLKDNPDAYLFGHYWKGEFRNYSESAFNNMLRKYAKLENKKVYPHLFRHTGLTEMANHLTEFQLKQLAGWTMDSKQASRYVHLSNDDLENKILELHNIKPPKQDESVNTIDLVKCPRCDYTNSDLDRYCSRCGSALNVQVVLEQKEDVETILRRFTPDIAKNYKESIQNIEKTLDTIKQKLSLE